MAAGDSVVSICNLALFMVGEDPIASLQDARKAAVLCSTVYDPARREVLEEQPWKFAMAQATLAASITPPAFSYSNAFPLPADFIRLIDEPEEDQPEYEIMGGMILSNDDAPLQITYVRDIVDPTQFSPMFVRALSCKLAAMLAQPITQSITKENEVAGKYQDALDRAALSNSQQASSREFDEDIWLRARR